METCIRCYCQLANGTVFYFIFFTYNKGISPKVKKTKGEKENEAPLVAAPENKKVVRGTGRIKSDEIRFRKIYSAGVSSRWKKKGK